MSFHNACKLMPQTAELRKKMDWHRIDCLAANQLKTERDHNKLKTWFSKQDEHWQLSRKARFYSRINDRLRMY